MTPREADTPPPVEIAFPDLAAWSSGNAGLPYVWRFAASEPGPRVTVQALTHGNEVCGAIALDWLLRTGFEPSRGVLNVVFANPAAYQSFDPADPFASRCLDEDFNRLWSADVLDGPRRSRELARARALRPVYDDTQFLLDLHSMTEACPALSLAGRHPKGLALARALGLPQVIVIDAGHTAGKRLRDYAFFDDANDPRAALLIECGQHWERAAPVVAQQALLRFLRHFELADDAFLDRFLDPAPELKQTAIEITDVVTIRSDAFRFALPVQSLLTIERAGTVLAYDGPREIRTPHDGCVLIMPTRRPREGETAVRLGRIVT